MENHTLIKRRGRPRIEHQADLPHEPVCTHPQRYVPGLGLRTFCQPDCNYWRMFDQSSYTERHEGRVASRARRRRADTE